MAHAFNHQDHIDDAFGRGESRRENSRKLSRLTGRNEFASSLPDIQSHWMERQARSPRTRFGCVGLAVDHADGGLTTRDGPAILRGPGSTDAPARTRAIIFRRISSTASNIASSARSSIWEIWSRAGFGDLTTMNGWEACGLLVSEFTGFLVIFSLNRDLLRAEFCPWGIRAALEVRDDRGAKFGLAPKSRRRTSRPGQFVLDNRFDRGKSDDQNVASSASFARAIVQFHPTN
jgi:hypothetical protein